MGNLEKEVGKEELDIISVAWKKVNKQTQVVLRSVGYVLLLSGAFSYAGEFDRTLAIYEASLNESLAKEAKNDEIEFRASDSMVSFYKNIGEAEDRFRKILCLTEKEWSGDSLVSGRLAAEFQKVNIVETFMVEINGTLVKKDLPFPPKIKEELKKLLEQD